MNYHTDVWNWGDKTRSVTIHLLGADDRTEVTIRREACIDRLGAATTNWPGRT